MESRERHSDFAEKGKSKMRGQLEGKKSRLGWVGLGLGSAGARSSLKQGREGASRGREAENAIVSKPSLEGCHRGAGGESESGPGTPLPAGGVAQHSPRLP